GAASSTRCCARGHGCGGHADRFNLAPVTAGTYWPQDQWTALLTMLFTGFALVVLRGFWSRIAIFLGLAFGYLVSWILDRVFGKIHSPPPEGGVGRPLAPRPLGGEQGRLGRLPPTFHAPSFSLSAVLVALPVVIALIAENAGHVKAVGEMTGDPLDDQLGTAIMADGAATVLSTSVGGPATTTYAENIGVMAATRVYSTAAYWCAAGFAILFGLCPPKFGAVVAAIPPGGVLGGITVILYGMIGLLGARSGSAPASTSPTRSTSSPWPPAHRGHRQRQPDAHRQLRAQRHRAGNADRRHRLPRPSGPGTRAHEERAAAHRIGRRLSRVNAGAALPVVP
nr:hypothetical protein [Streptomyces sp. SID7803]